ncbi:MAG: hypothetical protein IJN63_08015 [Clostridia bacterium]|nr:hypothetical protein [Clostridia bacterium]
MKDTSKLEYLRPQAEVVIFDADEVNTGLSGFNGGAVPLNSWLNND